MPRSSTTGPSTADPSSQPISEVKAELFKALAHPARIRILEVLSDGERSVGEMQPLVGIELSHLSQQLAVLRRARLVTSRKDGATVIYAIKDKLVVQLLQVAKRLLINSLSETSDLLADLRGAV
jgi:DNA-binding transcriptional ArsR family regulator